MPKRKDTSVKNVTGASSPPSPNTTKKNPTWAELPFWKLPVWEGLNQRMLELDKEDRLVPKYKMVFRPLLTARPDQIRVIFLGLDPHDSYNASPDGFAYSDSNPFKPIDSMNLPTRALFRAWLKDPSTKDLRVPRHTSLRHWASQGVLLWNLIPVREKGKTMAFLGSGFSALAVEIMEEVSKYNKDIVIVRPSNPLFAQLRVPKTCNLLTVPKIPEHYSDSDVAFVSAHIFTKVNETLKRTGQKEIDWRIK